MTHHSICGMVKNWLPSYLNNKKQYINGYNWSIEKVIFGVLQGFLSSPVLFFIHVKDPHVKDLAIKCSRYHNSVADTSLLSFLKKVKVINKHAKFDFIGLTY